MKILIDTHIAIWAMAASDKLPEEVVKIITDLNNIKEKMKIFKDDIDRFNNNIDEMIDLLISQEN